MKRILLIGVVIAGLGLLVAGFAVPAFANGANGGAAAPQVKRPGKPCTKPVKTVSGRRWLRLPKSCTDRTLATCPVTVRTPVNLG